MYYLIEETKESTNFYYVQTEKWCLSLVYFYASEIFEITGIFAIRFLKITFPDWINRNQIQMTVPVF